MLTTFFRSAIKLGLLAVVLAGCTTEVSPYRTSTADYVFGYGRLQDYLSKRRTVLAGLQGRLDTLSDQVAIEIGKLDNERKQLERARQTESISGQHRAALESNLAQQQQRADAIFSRLLNAEGELSSLKSSASEAQRQQDADRRRIQMIQSDIKRLESETEILQGTVDDSIRLRVEQSLR